MARLAALALLVAPVSLLSALPACGSDESSTPGAQGGQGGGSHDAGGAGGSSGSGGPADGGGASGQGGAAGTTQSGWPASNAYAWDGSWTPKAEEFPLSGLLDDEYFDGHPDAQGEPTPVLPPGEWDWSDADNDLANWRNFETNLGSFSMLRDDQQRHFGWRLKGNSPGAVDFSGPAAYFEGSSGADWLDLGADGAIHSYADGDLGPGPDVLVFRTSWSLDFRTGTQGDVHDNDLIVAGSGADPDGSFDIETTTIHTGPGSDWAFVRDISRAAVDLGNGQSGRTDAVDAQDGDDLVVLRGNTHDFRVFGGGGDDTAVWFVDDDVQTTTWLGTNFFGAGGWDDAVWSDDGQDRLVLAIPADTQLVTKPPTPAGGLLVMQADGALVDDAPTAGDPFAHYCVECGTSPGGRKTMIVEYDSADGAIKTGYFYVTAFELLQVGVGSDAVVYRIDDVAGTLAKDDAVPAFVPPSWPTQVGD